MPFINGRFYANPAYGEALERARSAESGAKFGDGLARYGGENLDVEPIAQHHAIQNHHPAHNQPHAAAPKSPSQIANSVYNETSGLRSVTERGPGSAEDLHTARVYISHVIQNRDAAGTDKLVAPTTLRPAELHATKTYPPAHEAYEDSVKAARNAASSQDPTGDAKNYYLDYGQNPPPWAANKKPVAVFGPFLNAAGGGGMHNPKKGDKVMIRVYHLTP